MNTNFFRDRANGRGGFGSQTAADPPPPPGDPQRTPEKQTEGTGTASHKILTLQALSSSLNAGTAKRGCWSRGKAVESPPAVSPPERQRPFARYRFFFSNFSGTAGISQQNPGISRPKSLISLVSRHIPNFLAPTRARGRPLPHRRLSAHIPVLRSSDGEWEALNFHLKECEPTTTDVQDGPTLFVVFSLFLRTKTRRVSMPI